MNPALKLLAAAMIALTLGGCASHEGHDSDEAREMHEGHDGDEAGEKHESESDENKGAAALAKLPQPAQDAIRKVAGKHELGDVDSETDNGKTTYEADYKVKKSEYSVTVDAEGNILEREVGVEASAVPPAVTDAVSKAHPGATLGEIDITEADGKLFYEMDVKASDNKYEMRVNADGSVMSDAVDKD